MANEPPGRLSDAMPGVQQWNDPHGLGWQVWNKTHNAGLLTASVRQQLAGSRLSAFRDRTPLATAIFRRWRGNQGSSGYWSQLDLPLFRMRMPAGEIDAAPELVGPTSLSSSRPTILPSYSSQPDKPPVSAIATLPASPRANIVALPRLPEVAKTSSTMFDQSAPQTSELRPIPPLSPSHQMKTSSVMLAQSASRTSELRPTLQLLPNRQMMRTFRETTHIPSDGRTTVTGLIQPRVADNNTRGAPEGARHSELIARFSRKALAGTGILSLPTLLMRRSSGQERPLLLAQNMVVSQGVMLRGQAPATTQEGPLFLAQDTLVSPSVMSLRQAAAHPERAPYAGQGASVPWENSPQGVPPVTAHANSIATVSRIASLATPLLHTQPAPLARAVVEVGHSDTTSSKIFVRGTGTRLSVGEHGGLSQVSLSRSPLTIWRSFPALQTVALSHTQPARAEVIHRSPADTQTEGLRRPSTILDSVHSAPLLDARPILSGVQIPSVASSGEHTQFVENAPTVRGFHPEVNLVHRYSIDTKTEQNVSSTRQLSALLTPTVVSMPPMMARMPLIGRTHAAGDERATRRQGLAATLTAGGVRTGGPLPVLLSRKFVSSPANPGSIMQREGEGTLHVPPLLELPRMGIGQRHGDLLSPDFTFSHLPRSILSRSLLLRPPRNVTASRGSREVHNVYVPPAVDITRPMPVFRQSNQPSMDDRSRGHVRLDEATTIATPLRPEVVLSRTAGIPVGASAVSENLMSRTSSISEMAKAENENLSSREWVLQQPFVSQHSLSPVNRSLATGAGWIASQSPVLTPALLVRRALAGPGISSAADSSALSRPRVQPFPAPPYEGGGTATPLAMVHGAVSIFRALDGTARSFQTIGVHSAHGWTGVPQTMRDTSTMGSTDPTVLLRPLSSRPQSRDLAGQVLSRLTSGAFPSLAMTGQHDDRFMRAMGMVSQTTPPLGVLLRDVGPVVWNQHATAGQRFADMPRSVAPFVSNATPEPPPNLPLVQTVRAESNEIRSSVPQANGLPTATPAFSQAVTPLSMSQPEAAISGTPRDTSVASPQSQVDLDEVVEKVWKKLMLKVTIEQERRGSTRWA